MMKIMKLKMKKISKISYKFKIYKPKLLMIKKKFKIFQKLGIQIKQMILLIRIIKLYKIFKKLKNFCMFNNQAIRIVVKLILNNKKQFFQILNIRNFIN